MMPVWRVDQEWREVPASRPFRFLHCVVHLRRGKVSTDLDSHVAVSYNRTHQTFPRHIPSEDLLFALATVISGACLA